MCSEGTSGNGRAHELRKLGILLKQESCWSVNPAGWAYGARILQGKSPTGKESCKRQGPYSEGVRREGSIAERKPLVAGTPRDESPVLAAGYPGARAAHERKSPASKSPGFWEIYRSIGPHVGCGTGRSIDFRVLGTARGAAFDARVDAAPMRGTSHVTRASLLPARW